MVKICLGVYTLILSNRLPLSWRRVHGNTVREVLKEASQNAGKGGRLDFERYARPSSATDGWIDDERSMM